MSDAPTEEAARIDPAFLPGTIIPTTIDQPITIQQIGRITNKEDILEAIIGYLQPGFIPAVQSARTGNVYVLTWDHLVHLAVDKGIHEIQVLRPPEKKLIIPGQ